MKTLFYKWIFFLFISVLLVSCKKWLNTPNPSAYDSETVFSSLTTAQMAVLGAYSEYFDRDFYYRLADGTDECISIEGIGGSKWLLSNYEYSPSIVPDDPYTAMSMCAEYANVCIKGLSAMHYNDSTDQKELNMLLGESYALRGLAYFNLVRYWGDVPYRTIPVADDSTLYSSRVSRDTIYDGCVSDLQKAVSLLPWYSEGMISTPERFSKNSAYGILARVALYGAGYSLRWDLKTYAQSSVTLAQRTDASRIKQLYQIASDACDAVIERGENSLLPDYATVFKDLNAGVYDKETMLLYGQYGTQVNGAAIGYTIGLFANSSSLFGKALPLIGVTPTLWFDYSDADTRRGVTIANYGITATNQRQMNPYGNNCVGKYRATWTTGTAFAVNKRSIDWPYLRYSDVLLMYAEAQNELYGAPTADGEAALAQVRTRAFGGDVSKIGTIPTDYKGFRNAIMVERKLELAFEGLRKTDLIRWGVLYDTISQAKQNVLDMANHVGLYANIDSFRAYKMTIATGFSDTATTIPYIGYKTAPTQTQQDSLTAAGYTLLNMYTGAPVTGMGSFPLQNTAPWLTGLFEGIQKDMVECFPLSVNMINDNPGLTGEQQPMYQ